MMFPQTVIGPIEQALRLLSCVRDGSLDRKEAKLALRQPMPADMKALLEKALPLRSGGSNQKTADEWRRFHDSAPCLSGQDLRDLGYNPGPVFKQIFEAVREARWEGKLRTREEEIRFILHAFPTGQNV
jgi:hypothetical protein